MIDQGWALEKIAAREAARNWAALPSDYEASAVQFLFAAFKDHFCKRREIRNRINASKATTFAELRTAILGRVTTRLGGTTTQIFRIASATTSPTREIANDHHTTHARALECRIALSHADTLKEYPWRVYRKHSANSR